MKNITFADYFHTNTNDILKEYNLKIISDTKDIIIAENLNTYIKEENDNDYIYNLCSTKDKHKWELHKKLIIKYDNGGAYIKVKGIKKYINSSFDNYIDFKTWTNENKCVEYIKKLSYNTGKPKWFIFKHPRGYYLTKKAYENINLVEELKPLNYELRGWVQGNYAFKNN